MAPEEFERGATIDQVTNVLNLRRCAAVLLGDGTASPSAWKGTDAMKEVVVRTTSPERSQRHQSVRLFVQAWRSDARDYA